MYICKTCNYITNIKHSFNIHVKGKKHIELELTLQNTNENEKKDENIDENIKISRYVCVNCNKCYEYNSWLLRHLKTCKKRSNDKEPSDLINSELYYKLERTMIEKEVQHKLQLLKLENELKKKEYENKLLQCMLNNNTSNSISSN